MRDLNTDTLIDHASQAVQPDHNVQGWERAGSVAGGMLLVGKGIRRGGILGLLQIALGGVALARGFRGQSATKRIIEKGRQDLDNVRSKIERAGDELVELKNSAEKATSTATVTGNDGLTSPKL